MTDEIEKIIKEAADKIAMVRGKNYSPTANDIQKEIDQWVESSPVEYLIQAIEKLITIQTFTAWDRIKTQARLMEEKQKFNWSKNCECDESIGQTWCCNLCGKPYKIK